MQTATWRRYVYLLPLQDARLPPTRGGGGDLSAASLSGVPQPLPLELDVDVERVNAQLSGIKGEPLHFNAMAYKEIKKLQDDDEAVSGLCGGGGGDLCVE